MSESLVGVSVAATRQKDGSPDKAVVAPEGVNGPAGTACAAVMRTLGRPEDARLSHAAGARESPLAPPPAWTVAARATAIVSPQTVRRTIRTSCRDGS